MVPVAWERRLNLLESDLRDLALLNDYSVCSPNRIRIGKMKTLNYHLSPSRPP